MEQFSGWEDRELLAYFQLLLKQSLNNPEANAPDLNGRVTITDQVWQMNTQLGTRFDQLVGHKIHTQTYGILWPRFLLLYQKQIQKRLVIAQDTLRDIAAEMSIGIPPLSTTMAAD